ncbi:hypothetical protein F5Y00DRAFT_265973 [Daldinia vernicosa]|uniref:uncharacterized protein n=1 Tax=Daldinia vernicosa TaxID=114800 RepID=UPI0020073A12|nr:uncharacterized protein F5Y00DRAFT_265973 [Daldinia vernicosa]KAI0845008.1 hypothetical protein F5Y00DRAFT_265973 [Daldinia vernicosa]
MAPYTMFHSHGNNTSVTPRWLTTEGIATTLARIFDRGSFQLSRRGDPYHRNFVTYIIVGSVVFLFLLVIPVFAVCRRKTRWGSAQRNVPSNTSAGVNNWPKTTPTWPTPESWEQELRDWRDMHWATQAGTSDHFIVPPSSAYASKRRLPVYQDGENDDEVFVVGSLDDDDRHHEGLRSPMVIDISTATAMPIKNVSGRQKSIDLGSAKGRESWASSAPSYWDSIVDDVVKKD